MSIDQLTEKTASVLASARKSAAEAGHETDVSLFVMLALMEDPTCVGARFLKRIGIKKNNIKNAINSRSQPTSQALSERALVAKAHEESKKLGTGYVGTEHLLLVLLKTPECITVLKRKKLTSNDAIAKFLMLLGKSGCDQ